MIRRFISECYTCFDITSGVLSLVYFHTDSARRMTNSYYRPQTKFAKIMFLHLSVSHSVHRGGGSTWAGTSPSGRYTPQARTLPPWVGTQPGHIPSPRQVHPRAGTPPRQVQPTGRYTPPGRYTPRAGSVCWDTVNKRAVRIPLECILV